MCVFSFHLYFTSEYVIIIIHTGCPIIRVNAHAWVGTTSSFEDLEGMLTVGKVALNLMAGNNTFPYLRCL